MSKPADVIRKPIDYAGIRGFNYTQPDARNDREFWLHYSHETVDRDMGYAERLRLNSARIFLSYTAYRKDPDGYGEEFPGMFSPPCVNTNGARRYAI